MPARCYLAESGAPASISIVGSYKQIVGRSQTAMAYVAKVASKLERQAIILEVDGERRKKSICCVASRLSRQPP